MADEMVCALVADAMSALLGDKTRESQENLPQYVPLRLRKTVL